MKDQNDLPTISEKLRKTDPFLKEKDKTRIYSQYKPRQFWNYINPEEKYIYEVRIKDTIRQKDYQHIKKIAELVQAPYHYSGVFIKTTEQYWKTMLYAYKHQLTAYISVNPKRKSIHPRDQHGRPTYNGTAPSDQGIHHLMVDFDASKELKQAQHINSVEVCYLIAKKFLQDYPNINDYLLLSSGNGVQLLIRLDEFIPFPAPTYDENNQYIITPEVAAWRTTTKNLMQKILKKYSTSHVKIDFTSFEQARVGRAPFSMNWKDPENPKPAGIIEIREGKNEGLAMTIREAHAKELNYQEKAKKYNEAPSIAEEFKYSPESIRMSKLAQLLLTPGLPSGGRNNILFFQFKLLLRANNIDFQHPKVQQLIRDIERNQGDKFPMNEPALHYKFHPEAIINWCVEYNIVPIYEPFYYLKKRVRKVLEKDLFEPEVDSTEPEFLYYEELPEAPTTLRRLAEGLREEKIVWHDPLLRKRGLGGFYRRIIRTFGRKKFRYFKDSGILFVLLEKITTKEK